MPPADGRYTLSQMSVVYFAMRAGVTLPTPFVAHCVERGANTAVNGRTTRAGRARWLGDDPRPALGWAQSNHSVRTAAPLAVACMCPPRAVDRACLPQLRQ
ncbi:hypothetical protein GY45DRAFT_1327134 [Cubamyces sp. BRFM 1775]|nr:hypothetical protein GY45DRAFT_1327134 [Cubamyces sp. BRFM 1775]